MDLLWNIIAGLLMITGIIGSVAPILPGPIISYGGLLILQLKANPPFSVKFLVLMAVVVLLITILDYLIPIYGTKKFGGSKYGIWGCTIGLLAGFWFGPIGIIAGPFVGALLAELWAHNNSHVALKAAVGSFVGFLFGTLLKLICCFVMIYYFVVSL